MASRAGEYLGLPIYENTLPPSSWPGNREYEFRDSSYTAKGIAIYHGWLPLYSMAISLKAFGVLPDYPQTAGSRSPHRSQRCKLPHAGGEIAVGGFRRDVHDLRFSHRQRNVRRRCRLGGDAHRGRGHALRLFLARRAISLGNVSHQHRLLLDHLADVQKRRGWAISSGRRFFSSRCFTRI